MNKETFKKGMAVFVKAFPKKEFDFDVLWHYLSDIPDRNFMHSIDVIIQTHSEINNSVNVIPLIRDHALTKERLSAEEAWCEVLSEIRRVGAMGYPRFSNAATSRAVSCIGWRTICMSEMIGVERAHFYKAYDGVAKRIRFDEITNNSLGEDVRSVIEMVSKRLTANKG